MYINITMVGTDEIVSMVHWITRMTTKPMALVQILQKTHFLLKKGTKKQYMSSMKRIIQRSVWSSKASEHCIEYLLTFTKDRKIKPLCTHRENCGKAQNQEYDKLKINPCVRQISAKVLRGFFNVHDIFSTPFLC